MDGTFSIGLGTVGIVCFAVLCIINLALMLSHRVNKFLDKVISADVLPTLSMGDLMAIGCDTQSG